MDPRTYSISTKKFVGDAQGNLKELHTVQVKWEKGADGRPKLVDVPGKIFDALVRNEVDGNIALVKSAGIKLQ